MPAASSSPATALYRASTPEHLYGPTAEVGTSLLVVGFPQGFHDTLQHMPVVRQALIASSFGLRFQSKGYFLSDARTHRGISGALLVTRVADTPENGLGLNCTWYADILPTLTEQ